MAWSGWTWREVALAAWSGLSLDVWRRRAASGGVKRFEIAWSGLMWRGAARRGVAWRGVGGVERLEESVRYRRLSIGDVPLGLVDDGGQFIVVTLDNVPHYVPDEQVLAHNTVIPVSVNQVHTRSHAYLQPSAFKLCEITDVRKHET